MNHTLLTIPCIRYLSFELTDILNNEYTVIEASGIDEAVSINDSLQNKGFGIDAVITDSCELIPDIRQCPSLAALPIIVATEQYDAGIEALAFSEGANEYFSGSSQPGSIINRLNNIIHHSKLQDTQEYEHQRELLENLPCGAGIYTISGQELKAIYHNNKYWELVGRQETSANYSPLDSIQPEDRPYVMDIVRKLARHGKERECELHILHGDGHYLPFFVHLNIHKSKSGADTIYATYTSITETNITFRKMLPVALEAMMASATSLSFIKDRGLHYVCASKAFAQMAGIEDEKDIIGKTDYDLFEEDLARDYRRDDLSIISKNTALVDHIERIPSPDGSITRYSCTSKYVLHDSIGSIIGIYGIGQDITENRENYKKLKLLIDTIPGGLATYNVTPDSIQALYLSDGIINITKYSDVASFDYKTDQMDYVMKEDRPELYRQANQAYLHGTPINCFYRIIQKDGSYRWVNIRGAVAERNEYRAIVNAVIFDIHDQMISNIRLNQLEQENRRKYEHELSLRKSLIQNAVFYYQINLTTGIVEEYESVNNEIANMEKGTRLTEQILGYIVSRILPEDLDKVRNSTFPDGLRRIYEKGDKSVSVIYRRLLSDNSTYHWIRLDAFMMEKPNSKDIIAFLSCHDIDREWKDHLSIDSLLNKDIESIFHIDVNSGTAYIAHMNEQVNYNKVYDSFDFEAESNKSCNKIIVPEDKAAFHNFYCINELILLLANSNVATMTYSVNDSTGIHRKMATAYYLNEHKDIIVLTRRDITKLYNDDLEQKGRLREAVDIANKANMAKSNFLSHMSHDLRTPLNAVLAFSSPELLKDANEDKLREYMNKVNVSGEYLLGIVNDVLDMSRIEQNKIILNPQPYYLCDFEDTIRNIIEGLCRIKNIEFIIDKSKATSKGLVVDKVRFNQIFMNLLSNAVKFTPEGGRVEFIIEEHSITTDNRVNKRFSIRDNGIGMSSEFIPHAFECFNQEYRQGFTDSSQGTGLGLPIVKELVRLMNGTIALESTLDKGTTFTVELPFEGTDILMSNKEITHNDYSILKGVHILLAEDNDINTEIALEFLEKYDCIVDCTDNGSLACKRFMESDIGYYQLILMDIRMPVMNGLDATRTIRSMNREDAGIIPIIAMTADAFYENVLEATQAGMNDHLSKPVISDNLYRICCKYIRE